MTLRTTMLTPRRGEVWIADMTQTCEATFGGDRKMRPVVVLSRTMDPVARLARCVVVPCTTKQDSALAPLSRRVEWPKGGGEIVAGVAVAGAVCSVDERAMRHRVATLDQADVDAIGVSVAVLARGLTGRTFNRRGAA